ncbi:ABC transporter ATP-binding protein [Cryobacterium sp. SO2]|uniref:ABC transporter ATP-binding protein n=1 Tax=Cryobacterium sp. SO2 TaxID=1897060 RepID=UPI00223CFD1E|nr:ABC transporter ATP-binding protein [Cryobacterium sp. SO2]WEO77843.1 ABC transporter ATP-binding protein [Cryobacterium sp. SO2]
MTSTEPAAGGYRLAAEGARLGYPQRAPVSEHLDVRIPAGSFTVIVGPNACGKSTLLRALSRLLAPSAGRIVLDGRAIDQYPTKEVARRIGLLPQTSVAPDGITVAELVSRGRFPHQGLLHQWSPRDEDVVRAVMERTGVTELAHRSVDELSGGQRQRVSLAMALAQETSILLLDEPTTFLDIAHQMEVLELCRDLNEVDGITIVAVLHDLNQACRFATHIIAMADGVIVGEGAPAELVTAELVKRVFGLDCLVMPDPVTGTPLTLPLDRSRVPLA